MGLGIAAGAYRVAQPIKTAGQWDMLPGGHRVLGVNISGRSPTQWLDAMWAQWEWDAWIKPQIDMTKAQGGNTLKLLGTIAGRTGSGTSSSFQIDQPTYLARWDQALSYIRAQGMYCYPCFGGDSNVNDYGGYAFTPTTSWFATEAAILARFMRKYADIIVGIDIAVEAINWASTSGNGLAVYRAAKTEAPELKFTYSKDFSSVPNPGGNNAQGTHYPATNMVDYMEPHIYYDLAAGDLDSTMSFYNMPVVIGEFGQTISAGTPARQSRCNTVKAAVNNVTAGRQLGGAILWNGYDQANVATNQWGLADANGNVRADIAPIFSSFPA